MVGQDPDNTDKFRRQKIPGLIRSVDQNIDDLVDTHTISTKPHLSQLEIKITDVVNQIITQLDPVLSSIDQLQHEESISIIVISSASAAKLYPVHPSMIFHSLPQIQAWHEGRTRYNIRTAPAKYLYTGYNHKVMTDLVKILQKYYEHADIKHYILSPFFGLIPENQSICSYEIEMIDKSDDEIFSYFESNSAISKLQKIFQQSHDLILIELFNPSIMQKINNGSNTTKLIKLLNNTLVEIEDIV